MWKKNLRSREPVIGSPTLLTTTFDTATLQTMTTINSATNPQNHPDHKRRGSDHHGPGLPPLPFKPMEQDSRRANPHSRPPVASSIYSKHDSYAAGNMSTANYDAHPSKKNPQPYQSQFRDSQYTDISPPDSPVFAPTGHPRESPDVSPIDNDPPQFPPPRAPLREPLRESRPPSAVPTPSKDVTGKPNTVAAPAPSKSYASSPPSATLNPISPSQASNRLTRWDDFSGELTHDEKGKVGQARPGGVVPKESPRTKQSSKQGFNLRAKGKELNEARKKLMEGRRHADKNDKHDLTQLPQEPWKGASGRAAIVKPIEIKKPSRPQPPLSIQTQPGIDNSLAVERKSLPRNNAAGGLPPLKVSKSRDAGSVPNDPTIKPIVPLKAGNNTPTSARAPLTPASHSMGSGTPSQSETPRATQHEIPEPDLATRLQNINLEQQPSSRFSATTYATTEAPSSPPGTPRARTADKDAPPIPSMFTERTETISSQTFVKATRRKPTPSEITTSSAKTLPRSPPELEADNRIDAMEARLNDLAQRKGNINTILNELTQVIQPSSIAYDQATRSEVKKSVNSLNNELMAIRMEEHDVGMKLMRARKKLDQNEYYQPSSIWVKRVTADY